MGAMRLAEAVDQEAALLQKIQTAFNFRIDPLPENATEAEQAARTEQYRQNRETGLQLCNQFLKAYPESEQYDSVYFKKLYHIRNLRRDAEFDAGVETFLSERPSSNYASKFVVYARIT